LRARGAPLDVSTFVSADAPGVYRASFPWPITGLVEMDGDQFRYEMVKSRKDVPLPEGVSSEVDLVAKQPSRFYYEAEARTLYVHTSDGKPPSTHEMERLDRDSGIRVAGKHYVTVMGFTFRHMTDGGITFYSASDCTTRTLPCARRGCVRS